MFNSSSVTCIALEICVESMNGRGTHHLINQFATVLVVNSLHHPEPPGLLLHRYAACYDGVGRARSRKGLSAATSLVMGREAVNSGQLRSTISVTHGFTRGRNSVGMFQWAGQPLLIQDYTCRSGWRSLRVALRNRSVILTS